MSNAVPVRVNSQAELVAHLEQNPLQLRAARMGFGPRVGHHDFIGPYSPDLVEGPGRIRFEAEGRPFFVIEKEIWEYEGTTAWLEMLGEES